MGKQRTWDLACERAASNDRTFPSGHPGMGENVAPGRTRTSEGQRHHGWTSSKAQYRYVRPDGGKGREWTHGDDRSHYDGPISLLISLTAHRKATPKQRKLTNTVRELHAERARAAKLGDVPQARLERLEQVIRAEADFLAGVTTGDVNRAALVAAAARKCL